MLGVNAALLAVAVTEQNTANKTIVTATAAGATTTASEAPRDDGVVVGPHPRTFRTSKDGLTLIQHCPRAVSEC